MLTWVVLSGLGLGTTSFISMCAVDAFVLGKNDNTERDGGDGRRYNIAYTLDNKYCRELGSSAALLTSRYTPGRPGLRINGSV